MVDLFILLLLSFIFSRLMGLGNEGIGDIGKADLEKDRETENLKAVELLCSMLIAFYGSVICGSL